MGEHSSYSPCVLQLSGFIELKSIKKKVTDSSQSESARARAREGESGCELFIDTQFSNLSTVVDTSAVVA